MKIPAYDEVYLNYAMTCLAEAVDYACYALKVDLDVFFTTFISSTISHQFEKGNTKYICGMSGSELAIQVMNNKATHSINIFPERNYYSFSPEYWTGWILAYYQWISQNTFENILNSLPASEIFKLYHPYHEASEEKAAEIIDNRIKNSFGTSKLQRARKNINMSQSELAKAANVNLRTLQQYEIKAKNINNAAVETVLNLCTVLHCDVEDLIE